MITPFPADLLAMLDGEWATAKGALKQGLASQNAGQVGYGRFDSDVVVPGGTLTYAVGTWVPIDVSGANLVLTNPLAAPCRYVQIGRMVYLVGAVGVPANANGAALCLGGIPVVPQGDKSANGAYEQSAITVGFSDQGAAFTLVLSSHVSAILAQTFGGIALTNAAFSGKQVRFSGWYLAAS